MIKQAKSHLDTLKFDALTVLSAIGLLISICGFVAVTFFLVPVIFVDPHTHIFEMLVFYNAPLLILIILFLGVLTKRRWSIYLCHFITANLILYIVLDFIFTVSKKGYVNYNDKSTALIVALFIGLSWYLWKVRDQFEK